MLIYGQVNGQIKIWDITTKKTIHQLFAHQDMVFGLKLLADNQTLISISHDCTIKFWQLSTGKCLATLKGHRDRILDLDLSHDDKYLATVSHDETIKIWDICEHKCHRTLHLKLLYSEMNLKNTQGLTFAQQKSLKTLGAKSEVILI